MHPGRLRRKRVEEAPRPAEATSDPSGSVEGLVTSGSLAASVAKAMTVAASEVTSDQVELPVPSPAVQPTTKPPWPTTTEVTGAPVESHRARHPILGGLAEDVEDHNVQLPRRPLRPECSLADLA